MPLELKPICFDGVGDYEIYQSADQLVNKQFSIQILECKNNANCETDTYEREKRILELQFFVTSFTKKLNNTIDPETFDTHRPLMQLKNTFGAFSWNKD